ncbi:XRE family transcriptional regulator [Rothia sp. AR01]|uniref:XRE family transcriptional regulator n=1 Tax=Rothia santali TaxID=2949643 RepID=A0A9X2HDC6_9MICC|nr:XRE family transcriptional regulator [Rothia santali]MCP3425622.1 XRE family transcriptional regulator [Rothia santali]
MERTSTSRSHDPALHPERISLARMRRGLTKIELAAAVGVSARTVTTFEAEGAPPERAAGLSAATGFPASYFSRGAAPDVPADRMLFRAGRGTTSRQRHAAIAAGASGIEVDRLISARYALPAVDVPDGTGEDPVLMARMLRQMWGLGTRPLPNLVQLCESRGVRVYGLPELAESVDAYSIWHEEVPYVFLARRKTPERSRFDVAHELGHLILHAGLGCASRQVEREADRFAGELLMPESGVFEHLPANPSVERLLAVREAFKVSATALAYRAHQVGRMSDWAYRHTSVRLDGAGYRTGEPDGMRHHERSKVFPQVFAPSRRGRLGAGEIAATLSLPEADVHALTFDSAMRLVVGEGAGPSGSPRAGAEGTRPSRAGSASGGRAHPASERTSRRAGRRHLRVV